MKKRFLSILLVLCMVLSIAPIGISASGGAGFTVNSVSLVGSLVEATGWTPDDSSNHMTKTSENVYEKTYNNMMADNYEFKFAINDSWNENFIGNIDSENAFYIDPDDCGVYDNIYFSVKHNNSIVRIVFDLTNFDYSTKKGAIYKVFVNGVKVNGAKNIKVGATALSGYDNTTGYDYIYYGVYQQNTYSPTLTPDNPEENIVYTDTDANNTKFIYRSENYYKYEPIKWRILDTKTNMNNAVEGDGLFLLSDVLLGSFYFQENTHSFNSKFHKGPPPSDNDHTNCRLMNEWQDSDAQSWCKNFYKNNLTKQEQNMVLSTTKSDEAYTSSNSYRVPYAASELSNEKVFLLSAKEAETANYGFTNDAMRVAKSGNSAGNWWLRSPVSGNTNNAGYVNFQGIVHMYDWYGMSARPAFNLKSSSILFTSAAVGGKASTPSSADLGIKKNVNLSTSEEIYKLTMLDSDTERDSFTIKDAENPTSSTIAKSQGQTVTLNYENAVTGTNEYVSAMIVDNSNEVTYYGQLKNTKTADDASGSVSFTIPDDFESGSYKLHLFNEQINGDYHTDFSSNFKTLNLNVKKNLTPDDFIFTPPSASDLIYDGNAKTVTVVPKSGIDGVGTINIKYFKDGYHLTEAKNIGTYTVKIDVSEGTKYYSASDLTKDEWKFLIAKIADTADDFYYKVNTNGVTITGVKENTITNAKIPAEIEGKPVTVIKEGVFSSCLNLIEVQIPDTVTTIETKAFCFCKMLETVNIPKSVTEMDSFSFYSCNSLKAYVVDSENTAYSSKDGVLFNKDGTRLKKYPNAKSGSYTIPDSTKVIEGNAFYASSNVTDITIPSSVELILSNPFANSVNMSSITVSEQNASFASVGGVLFNKAKDKLIAFPNGKSGTYEIPDGVTEIGSSSFNCCSRLTEVKIPDTVTTIGGYAFSACSGLTKINIPDGISEIGDYTFNRCIALQSISIPDAVTKIGDYAFSQCYYLTNVVIPHKVTTIGTEAFSNCVRLTTVAIPNSVTSIGENVFLKDESWIEEAEKDNIVDLQDIYFIGTPDEWNAITIDASNTGITSKVIYITHTIPTDLTYDKNAKEATISASVNDIGIITIKYYDENDAVIVGSPTDAGKYSFKIDIAASATHTAISNVYVGEFTIAPRTPTIGQNEQTVAEMNQGDMLSQAIVTYAKIFGLDGELTGTYIWDNGSAVIYSDCEAPLTFTPDDKNYTPIPLKATVHAYRPRSHSTTSKFTVSFETNGAGKISSQTIQKNNTATEPQKPTKEGYTFDGWYSDKGLTKKYDFSEKITKNITLYAKWTENEEQTPISNDWKNPFIDVSENDWFFDYVKYVAKNGLMNGMSENTFEPQTLMSRGMFAVTIYRLENEPSILNKSIPFMDVASDSYYFEAISWAQQNGIINGVTDIMFAPDENITREQIAVMLYRYAKYKEYGTSVGEDTNILSYTDFDEISEYAIEAMQYAVGSGLITGRTQSTLNPKELATRAELATILQRFVEYNK